MPRSVEPDLLSLGYTQVFRVAGVDRFDTAARVAQALGTKPVPDGTSGCVDRDVSDSSARMGWYAPSVVELRESPGACRLLGRTVVLADGGTGADALAAGWWTSFWQVPVLLTTGDGTLSAATRSALQATAVNNLIVLGGPARIPDATVNEAQSLTGAAVVRIAGADRYATAVEMAERLGGWWPTGDAADSAGSMVCLAASGGQGSNSVGWPDALGAGPLCAALNGAAANPGAPVRALPPAAGLSPTVTTGARPTRDAVPVLLVTPQSEDLPGSTQAFLAALFPSSSWCSSATIASGLLRAGLRGRVRWSRRRLGRRAARRGGARVGRHLPSRRRRQPIDRERVHDLARPEPSLRGRRRSWADAPVLPAGRALRRAVALGLRGQRRDAVRQRARRDDERSVRQ